MKLYLFIALKNTLFNVFEKDKSLFFIDTVEPVFTVEYSIEDKLIANEYQEEQKKYINKILDLLPPRQKEVLYYRYVKGMTLNEICDIMKINYQSVQNLIQRSIKKMHAILVEEKTSSLSVKMRIHY